MALLGPTLSTDDVKEASHLTKSPPATPTIVADSGGVPKPVAGEAPRERTVKEIALPPMSRPARSGPTWAIRDTFFGTAPVCHLSVAWEAPAEIGQILAEFAPTTGRISKRRGSAADAALRVTFADSATGGVVGRIAGCGAVFPSAQVLMV